MTFDDIKAAVTIDHLGATGTDPGPVQSDCNDHAKPLQSPAPVAYRPPLPPLPIPLQSLPAAAERGRGWPCRSAQKRRSAINFSSKKGSAKGIRERHQSGSRRRLWNFAPIFWTTRLRRYIAMGGLRFSFAEFVDPALVARRLLNQTA